MTEVWFLCRLNASGGNEVVIFLTGSCPPPRVKESQFCNASWVKSGKTSWHYGEWISRSGMLQWWWQGKTAEGKKGSFSLSGGVKKVTVVEIYRKLSKDNMLNCLRKQLKRRERSLIPTSEWLNLGSIIVLPVRFAMRWCIFKNQSQKMLIMNWI